MMENQVKKLAQIVSDVYGSLTFTLLDVGALPLGGQPAPFQMIPELFPGSQVIAFELDKGLCDQLNLNNHSGTRYFPHALGKTEEKRLLYETDHPMCTSLYRPNGELLHQYNGLDVARLKSVTSMDTISLDYFTKSNGIETVDFIKIDIQGAELDVFMGGTDTLLNVVAIVSEVEFIPLYYKQPLFGDVCNYLAEQNFMFHKFLGMAGRTLKPLVVNNDECFATQYMWSDAVFIRNILDISNFNPEKKLKMGILTYLYGSPDVSFHCFQLFDEQHGTSISAQMLTL